MTAAIDTGQDKPRSRTDDTVSHVREAANAVTHALRDIEKPYGSTLIVHCIAAGGGKVIIAASNAQNLVLDELIGAAKALGPTSY